LAASTGGACEFRAGAERADRSITRKFDRIPTLKTTDLTFVWSLSVASAVYLDNVLSDISYSMWTCSAVGFMGGVAGAGAGDGVNQAPTERYRIQKIIRNLDRETRLAPRSRKAAMQFHGMALKFLRGDQLGDPCHSHK